MATLSAIVNGLVRSLSPPNYSDQSEQDLAINNRGELLVSQALPELTELVRQGGTYQVALATGLAALTGLPTTTSGLTLWNGESTTGKSYIVEAFGSWEAVVDATQTDVTAIFACMHVTPVAAPTATALTMRSTIGKVYGGKARAVTTATVVNDGWFAHGTGGQMAAAAAGANWKVNEVQAHGLYIIPPGGSFSVQAVKAAAAAAAQQFFFVRWHEVLINFAT